MLSLGKSWRERRDALGSKMKLLVNGTEHDLDVASDMPLLWALRDFVGLTGTKFGCGIGLCGACVVHIDGKPARSCLTPVSSVSGKRSRHDRGHLRQGCRSGADGVAAARRRAMRLLPVGSDHERDRPIERKVQTDRRRHRECDGRQYLSMRNLCQDSGGDPRGLAHARLRRMSHVRGDALEKTYTLVFTSQFPSRLRRGSGRTRHWLRIRRRTHAEEAANGNTAGAGPKAPPTPDAFIRIAPDDSVTVLIKHLDMGQGVATGLTTIVAEELDADWSQMRAEFAPANAKLYNNLAFGSIQGTGGSTSVTNSWDQLRSAAATARAMLVAAAAEIGKFPLPR